MNTLSPPPLSSRLSKIDQMIGSDYGHIWDTCCDHGYLGMHLIARQAASNIHFVDIVPQIIETLEKKMLVHLSKDQIERVNWRTHAMDVKELPLANYPGKHLIVLAGVGGDLSKALVRHIQEANPGVEIDYLLCPVRQLFGLRRALREMDLQLKQEALVEEKGRIYELLLITSSRKDGLNNALITEAGSQIWQTSDPQNPGLTRRYHQQLIEHYRRKQASGQSEDIAALKAYEAITF